MSEEMFKEAVQAARGGQRRRAKDLLTRLLKADANNVDYWLWMSAVVETEKEQIFCLQKAVKIDPNSIAARRGLVVLGALKPEEAALPPVQAMETLQVEIPELSKSAGGLAGFLSRPRNREMVLIFGLGGVAVVLVVALGLAVLAPNLFRPRNVVVVTSTPRPADTAEATPLGATATLEPCTVPPNPNAATPLAVYLCLTQTPTPIFIATEAAPYEAYTSMKKGYSDGDWDKVLRNEDQVVRLLPDSARVYFYLGEAYRHIGQRTNALKNYRISIAKDANFAPAYWGKALVELGQGGVNDALADFDSAIKTDPTFLPPYLDRAQFYSENGNYPRALSDLQQAQLVAPGNALVLASLALAYVDNQVPQQALELAGQALTIDPGLALAYYARGRAEYALGQFEEADKDLSVSYKYVLASESLFPRLFQARVLYHFGLGKAGIGDDATALTVFNQALGLYDTFPLAFLARGQVYLRAEEYDQARADFNTAISQFQASDANNPAINDAYLGNGLAWLGLNRPENALTNFQVVVRNDPTNFAGYLGLGRSLLLMGRAADSLESFESALNLAQDDGQKAQVYYWRAQAFQKLGRVEEQVADLIALAALTGAPDDLASTAEAQLTAIGPLPTTTITPTVTLTPTLTPTPGKATATPKATATKAAGTVTPAAPTATARATGYPAGTGTPSAPTATTTAGGYPAPTSATATATRKATPTRTPTGRAATPTRTPTPSRTATSIP